MLYRQGGGFLALFVLLWLDVEIAFPALAGIWPAKKVWIVNGAIETVWVVILAVFTLSVQIRGMRRIQFLEGLLPICSFCKKIQHKAKWVPIEEYIRDHSAAEFTHGLCPQCGEEHYGDELGGDQGP